MKKDNRGRKPISDKKMQVCLYVRESDIVKFLNKKGFILAIFEKLNLQN